MAQQKIKLLNDFGAKSFRVLDAVTPVNGADAPAVNAKYLGQVYVDETNSEIYMAVAVGSETPADDWKKVSFAV